MQEINIIAAMTSTRVIGKDNKLPWHIPEDLKHFKELTTGHPVIMGRKTYESFGNMNNGAGLPNRTNIVLTHQSEHLFNPALTIVSSIKDALFKAYEASYCNGHNSCFVIGGAEIYKAFLDANLVNRVYLTVIDDPFLEGDTRFPELPESFYLEAATGPMYSGDYTYRFEYYAHTDPLQVMEPLIRVGD